MKIAKLNKNAFGASENPEFFIKIEECILNAKTELAKRRLVKTAVSLAFLSGASIQI